MDFDNSAFDVKDLLLAENGRDKIAFAAEFMPVLSLIRKRFVEERPLRGLRISACLHVTSETANLMLVLKAGGADICLCASNPLSTQDDVAACLVKNYETPVFAVRGEDKERYYRHIASALSYNPMITMDDGADLVTTLLSRGMNAEHMVLGGTEETTSGVMRLRNMTEKGVLPYPIIAVNDSKTKYLFDNRYGTGQSTLGGVIRATNILLAGLTVVVCGYGWCGKGVAMRARGLGANVIVTEVDPIRALEAKMDGYAVEPSVCAAKTGDLFITTTGNKNVLRKEHFESMKDGVILCNAGHFNVEIDVEVLEKLSSSRRTIRELIEEFTIGDKRIRLLAEGRLVNLACAEGHPPTVMDMSFANQALSVEYLWKNASKLDKKTYAVPEKIDKEIARLKLQSLGVEIDSLTDEQSVYLRTWSEGT